MTPPPATDRRPTRVVPRPALVAGVCAAVAGVCWVVKGLAILATGVQPPMLFEVAPLLMGLALLGLAGLLPSSARRTAAGVLGVVAVLAAVPVALDEAVDLPAAVTGTGMALAHLCVLSGLVVAGSALRRTGSVLPLAIGVATVPAVLLGGLAATAFGERVLEVPVVLLGLTWTALGAGCLRRAWADRRDPWVN